MFHIMMMMMMIQRKCCIDITSVGLAHAHPITLSLWQCIKGMVYIILPLSGIIYNVLATPLF